MTLSCRSFAFAALGFTSFACAVYDSDMLTALEVGSGSASDIAGATAAGSVTGNPTGGSASRAGSASTATGGNDSEGGKASNIDGGAGDPWTEGGAASDAGSGGGGDAHVGGTTSGGSASTGGTGGTSSLAGTGGKGGVEGGAGGPSIPLCIDHPITAKSNWAASVSHYSEADPYNPPSWLIDNSAKRWSTGKPQAGDEWLQVDFGSTVSIRSVNLQQGDQNSSSNDYPRSYAVYVSNKSKDLNGMVRASGAGTSGVTTTIALPKIFTGRYLLIKQLGSSLSWWSVVEIEVSCSD